MIHDCTTCGLTHDGAELAEAAADAGAPPVIQEAGTSENDVKVAEIQAKERVAVEKVWAEASQAELVAENERLRGELTGIKTTLESLQPPVPEPVPVPVPAPEPAMPEPPAVPPPPMTEPPSGKGKKDTGWFAGYR